MDSLYRFDSHECWGTDISVIKQPIESKPSLFARLGRNYIVKVSLKIQADDSFSRIINWKIHSRYICVYILGSLSPPQTILFQVLGDETLPRLLINVSNQEIMYRVFVAIDVWLFQRINFLFLIYRMFTFCLYLHPLFALFYRFPFFFALCPWELSVMERMLLKIAP